MADRLPTKLTLTSLAILEAEDEAGARVNESGEAVPPGQVLADLVANGLTSAGWKVEYRWTTYTSHAFDAQRAENRYDVEVALVERESARWTVTAKPRVGLLKRVFAAKLDPAEHELLRIDIDRALGADSRVTSSGWTVDEA